jgi:3-oxoadipate enol-lactonase
MPTLTLPDLNLYYERRGTGPRLLVFNGSGASIESAAALIDTLAEHFEVLVHDQRALGRTSIPEGPATMAQYAADAAALVDSVGWQHYRVFGISFGGMVAQEFAIARSAQIEALALLCTSPGGEGGSSYPLHKMAAMPAEEWALVSLRNLDTRFDDEWLAAHPSDRAMVTMMNERACAERSEEQRRGEAMQLAARRHHDVWDRLGLIRCPTFIACGEYDGLAPVSNSEAMRSRIRNAQLRRYQGGHLFVYQDRLALADIVSFLTDPAASGRPGGSP